jgi:hypothetical protein
LEKRLAAHGPRAASTAAISTALSVGNTGEMKHLLQGSDSRRKRARSSEKMSLAELIRMKRRSRVMKADQEEDRRCATARV